MDAGERESMGALATKTGLAGLLTFRLRDSHCRHKHRTGRQEHQRTRTRWGAALHGHPFHNGTRLKTARISDSSPRGAVPSSVVRSSRSEFKVALQPDADILL